MSPQFHNLSFFFRVENGSIEKKRAKVDSKRERKGPRRWVPASASVVLGPIHPPGSAFVSNSPSGHSNFQVFRTVSDQIFFPLFNIFCRFVAKIFQRKSSKKIFQERKGKNLMRKKLKQKNFKIIRKFLEKTFASKFKLKKFGKIFKKNILKRE